jgi:hypothetical protein
LNFGFVFTGDDGSATIRVVVFILPLLDLSTKQEKQQASTLHIGTHILSKDNTQGSSQTRYQLNSHLQSNTLELDDKAQTQPSTTPTESGLIHLVSQGARYLAP